MTHKPSEGPQEFEYRKYTMEELMDFVDPKMLTYGPFKSAITLALAKGFDYKQNGPTGLPMKNPQAYVEELAKSTIEGFAQSDASEETLIEVAMAIGKNVKDIKREIEIRMTGGHGEA